VSAWPLERIISGGQTGVDRAALDVALELGIECGGWCPHGRRAEDGRIPERYPLRETDSRSYPERTTLNVASADATLVLTRGTPRGGTALTVRLARRASRPLLVVDLDREPAELVVQSWLRAQEVRSLNVAGPRESDNPGIHDQAAAFLRAALAGG
jgi:hypothetical protein